jgi:hypothetical protein
MSEPVRPIYTKDAETEADPRTSVAPYQPVTHALVHQRFRALLAQHRDTGLAQAWKEALLEPPNPLKPADRAPLKLPLLYAAWILALAIGGFVWFSVSH